MSEDMKAVKPPIDSVTFVGYRGGELIFNVVETRASKEGDVLLNNKVWPFVRRVACNYERIQTAPFEVKDGELYAGVSLEMALQGLLYFLERKVHKLQTLQSPVQQLLGAVQRNETDVIKQARA